MSLRLHPDQRIRKHQMFQILFKKGRRARGKFLNVWSYAGPELGDSSAQRPQIGIVVSKKVSLRANKRNLWKRRIREAFRVNQASVKKKIAIVAQAKKQETMPSYKEIAEELKSLLKKTKSLKS